MKEKVQDVVLKEIIDYYITLTDLKQRRPEIDFNYGEIKTFDDSTRKLDSTINAKVSISNGRLVFYATPKLKELQYNSSLCSKRCMHQLIAHEIGHLYFCDNCVDLDMASPTQYMILLSIMRELRADIIGAHLISMSKYAEYLNLNSELAMEQAFDFVPITKDTKFSSYPNKQSRIYYAYRYGIKGSGVTNEAVVDMLLRYSKKKVIKLSDYITFIEKKKRRVLKIEKSRWYLRWEECGYLASWYLESNK